MHTFHIHITGQVQGVGFRPFVYVLASKFGLKGWVKNTIDGVHIVFNAEKAIADDFYSAVTENAPRLSIITNHQMVQIEDLCFAGFEIDHSEGEGKTNLLVTPDFAICPDCFAEMSDASNRRSAYPFITCTNCGPRFSIIRGLPYDRPLTTMESFDMCPDCLSEYTDPENRRYFSQTNSCPACPVNLTIKIKNEVGRFIAVDPSDQSGQIQKISAFLKEGRIIAIKGIGGFLLVCDASDPEVIRTLRLRKRRPSKAFAVMYPDMETVKNEFITPDAALDLMSGPVFPIVLLRPKPGEKTGICTELIAPGLGKTGVMVPYTPLFVLMMQAFGQPVIATSGNVSGSPIAYDNHQAEDLLGNIADVIVENDRDIVIPQDDSVVQFSDKREKKVILRRSRGLAPNYIDAALNFPDEQILAVGAELKSAFAHLFNRILYVSQYLGDQETYETKRVFEQNIRHCIQLFGSRPQKVIHDLHPGYLSTYFALEMSEKEGIPKFAIQHHEAHFAAVLGEHHLFDAREPVLGVIWDGVGYGADGQIWGGEFFGYQDGAIKRMYHIPNFDFILGDKMPREPRISALTICKNIPELQDVIRQKFSQTEWSVYQKLLDPSGNLKSSSMGRFFDAAASVILGIDRQTYEGEAAMLLEAAASAVYTVNESERTDYLAGWNFGGENLSAVILMRAHEEKLRGKEPGRIALNVHLTLVSLISRVAKKLGYRQLAFSGGVFQNALMVDLLIEELGNEFSLYFHERLSPNDECIAFGQLMHHLHIRQSK